MSDFSYSAVFCGDYCTLAVDEKGQLFVCGGNEGSRLGLQKELLLSGLQRFKGGLPAVGVVQAVAKRDVLCFLTADGALWFCGVGNPNARRLELPVVRGLARALAINAKGLHVLTEKSVMRFGKRGGGLSLRNEYALPSTLSVQDVGCTSGAMFARTGNGQVYVVGRGGMGELGVVRRESGKDIAVDHVTELTRVPIKYNARVSRVACGKRHVLALLDDNSNEIYAWGSNDSGQLGLGKVVLSQEVPVKIPSFGNQYLPVEIACGAKHSVAVLESKEVVGWGASRRGRLGLDNAGRNVHEPVLILKPDGDGVVATDVRVFCGRRHTVVLWDGALYVVGDNRFGQLGLPLETSQFMKV